MIRLPADAEWMNEFEVLVMQCFGIRAVWLLLEIETRVWGSPSHVGVSQVAASSGVHPARL